MAKKKSPSGSEHGLRARAEQVLKESGHRAPEDDAASADTLRLLHSLQVHEIELELQNEELLRARAEAEEHLARYADLYEHAPIGYLSLEPDGVIAQINLTGARLLGRERALLVGQRLESIVATHSRPALTSFLAGLSAQEAAQTCEVLVQPEGGAATTLELWGRLAADGRQYRLAALDVTRRRRAETGLVEAQAVARIGSWRYDVARDEATWTEEMYRIFDRDPDMGPPAWRDHRPHVHPDDWERLDAVVTAASEPGSGYREEFRIVRQDGTITWAETICRVVRGPDGTVERLTGTVQDITWRKTAEERLHETEATQRALIDAVPESLFLMAPDGTILVANQEVARRFDRTADTLVGTCAYDLVDEGTAAQRRAWAETVVETGEALEEVDEPGDRIVHNWVFPVEGENGRVVCLAVFGQDITVRERALRALTESEGRFRALIESLPVSILLLRDGAYTYGNPAAADLLGYDDPDRLVGLPALKTIAPELRDQVRERLARVADGGPNPAMEIELIRPDGRRVWTSSTSVPVSVDGRATTIIVGQDITERRRLEQQVARAQRLEAMGQLSAGVSHEYNNLLMGIIGYAHHLKRQVAVDTEAHLFASKIIEISEQAARVSRQLLDFARPAGGPREALDIDRLVDGTLATFGKLIGEDIVVHVDAKSQAHPEVDPEQIQDVLVNVLLNARDAMPDGGRLRTETRRINLDAKLAAQLGLQADRPMVRIAVADTGTGMEPEVRERAFEPFFSTKPHGRGTGLGLASALGIVQAHGGGIQVLSQPGEGTTVNLYLPCPSSEQ